MILSPDVAHTLAILAVYVGGVIGFTRGMLRLLRRDESWRAEIERHPTPAAALLAVLIVCWPASLIYLAWRTAARRHHRIQ